MPAFYSGKNTRQDEWVVQTVAGAKRGGYFVELGAAKGRDASNTYALETRFGWQGICIEANPDQFDALCKCRNCICENACVYSERQVVKFIKPGKHPGYGGIRSRLKDFKKEFWSVESVEIEVAAAPLEDILVKHNAPQKIQYLSIDIEGSEYDALCNFPFDRYQFEAITIEGARCDELLQDHGYRLVKSPFCEVEWEHFYLPAEPGAATSS